jgi:hypothetical protein
MRQDAAVHHRLGRRQCKAIRQRGPDRSGAGDNAANENIAHKLLGSSGRRTLQCQLKDTGGRVVAAAHRGKAVGQIERQNVRNWCAVKLDTIFTLLVDVVHVDVHGLTLTHHGRRGHQRLVALEEQLKCTLTMRRIAKQMT